MRLKNLTIKTGFIYLKIDVSFICIKKSTEDNFCTLFNTFNNHRFEGLLDLNHV